MTDPNVAQEDADAGSTAFTTVLRAFKADPDPDAVMLFLLAYRQRTTATGRDDGMCLVTLADGRCLNSATFDVDRDVPDPDLRRRILAAVETVEQGWRLTGEEAREACPVEDENTPFDPESGVTCAQCGEGLKPDHARSFPPAPLAFCPFCAMDICDGHSFPPLDEALGVTPEQRAEAEAMLAYLDEHPEVVAAVVDKALTKRMARAEAQAAAKATQDDPGGARPGHRGERDPRCEHGVPGRCAPPPRPLAGHRPEDCAGPPDQRGGAARRTETPVTALEAREHLILLIRARAPRAQIEVAADDYIRAIRERAQATGRRLPIPSRAGIIRLVS